MRERIWKIGKRVFDVSRHGLIMGVLNVTPDSFSDGGEFLTADKATERGLQMAAEGAHIIDVGGESTHPGSEPVTVDEELRRVIPVIENLRRKLDVPISIDTSKAEVARAAIQAGASIVNDVTGGRGDDTNAAARCRNQIGVHHHAHARNTPDDADPAALHRRRCRNF